MLPGGILPKRMTEGAIGYDIFARAVISPDEMEALDPRFHKILFDFKTTPDDAMTKARIVRGDKANASGLELMYRLDPGERVLIAPGFVIELCYPFYYRIESRSGLVTKHGVEVKNFSPGDSDFRGEPTVLLYNGGEDSFLICYGMRVAQLTFHKHEEPHLIEVKRYGDLSSTRRGTKGLGSTGFGGNK